MLDYKSTPNQCSTPEGNDQAVAAVLLQACSMVPRPPLMTQICDHTHSQCNLSTGIVGILAYPVIITVACFTHNNVGKGLKNPEGKKMYSLVCVCVCVCVCTGCVCVCFLTQIYINLYMSILNISKLQYILYCYCKFFLNYG